MSDLEASVPVEPEKTLEKAMAPEVAPAETEASADTKVVEHREVSALEAALAELEKVEALEVKLQLALDFMERSLAQVGAPHFKSFWEVRKQALEYFKGEVAPAIRAQLWARYTDLTKEARRLKEILDEQTAFAVEQIEMAIKALEEQLGSFAERLEQTVLPDFGVQSHTLEPHLDFYRGAQRELLLLNAEAARINALRKELIKTEMRVRQKNKFFQRLSAAGDHVFPRRKELIREVSDKFIIDVDGFVNRHFNKEVLEESLFALREEIKALQTIAKYLTLNTRSFTQTRTHLSECWNKIKLGEKERKKERLKQKATYRQHVVDLQQKIQEKVKAFQEGTLTPQQAHEQLDGISAEMRRVELGREEVQELRACLQEAYQPIRGKIREGEEHRRREGREKEEQRLAKVVALRQRIEKLLTDAEEMTVEVVAGERDAILSDSADKGITRSERTDLERLLKPVRDLLADKKAKALMNLPVADQHALQELKDILKEHLALRAEIKAQLEQYRKALGGSGLDFEQAMQFNEQQRLERERLEKAEHSIQEIQEKIADLEAKI